MDPLDNPKDRKSPSVSDLYDRLEEIIRQLPRERQKVAFGMLNAGTLANDLRTAVTNSGMTHYAIGKASGVAPEMIDRFMTGRDIRLTTASKICEVLGYGLAKIEPQASKPAKKKAVKKKRPPA